MQKLASISCAVTSGGRLFYIEDEAPHAYISFMSDWKLIVCVETVEKLLADAGTALLQLI